jgi:small subunit ribosomal protein S3
MGQKVNPVGLRIGINKPWQSQWYAGKKEFATWLHEDIQIRKYIEGRFAKTDAGISSIIIEREKRDVETVKINIYAGKRGIVHGTDGETLKDLIKNIGKKLPNKKILIEIVQVSETLLDATLVAKDIARGLENRGSFRMLQKKAIIAVMKAGARGVKTLVSGRLNGAEIARSEGYSQGSVSLHTLRADVDYAIAEAKTTYGILGVKVWISRPLAVKERK